LSIRRSTISHPRSSFDRWLASDALYDRLYRSFESIVLRQSIHPWLTQCLAKRAPADRHHHRPLGCDHLPRAAAYPERPKSSSMTSTRSSRAVGCALPVRIAADGTRLRSFVQATMDIRKCSRGAISVPYPARVHPVEIEFDKCRIVDVAYADPAPMARILEKSLTLGQ
jgi:hypothetical protein